MTDVDILMCIIIAIVIIAGVLLLIRAIVLWYYKIDARVENQQKIILQNKKIITILEEINDSIQSSLKQIQNEK